MKTPESKLERGRSQGQWRQGKEWVQRPCRGSNVCPAQPVCGGRVRGKVRMVTGKRGPLHRAL